MICFVYAHQDQIQICLGGLEIENMLTLLLCGLEISKSVISVCITIETLYGWEA